MRDHGFSSGGYADDPGFRRKFAPRPEFEDDDEGEDEGGTAQAALSAAETGEARNGGGEGPRSP